MNNNIFFNNNKKFNPDIPNKLAKKKQERKINYQLKNIVDKPNLKGKQIVDTTINIKQRQMKLQQERSQLDAILLKKNRNHRNIPIYNYTQTENISRPKKEIKKSSKKADKIIEDLKKLGIIK